MSDLLLEPLRFIVLAGLGVFIARTLQTMRADLKAAAEPAEPVVPRPSREPPQLIVEQGTPAIQSGQAFRILGDMVIGRSPAAHLVIPDRFVSMRHARLSVSNGTVLVSDLDSSNGTYVNEERIKGSGRLAPGDRLRVGSIVFQLRWPPAS